MSETISVLLSWNFLFEPALTVDEGPMPSPENRIFRAVPIPWVWKVKSDQLPSKIGLERVFMKHYAPNICLPLNITWKQDANVRKGA